MSVGEATSFFFCDCGGVDRNGPTMEARFFFSAAMDALFFLTYFGHSLLLQKGGLWRLWYVLSTYRASRERTEFGERHDPLCLI